ncbi:hypothetical protein CI789_02585 [Erwinia persicina]|uniref:hypothetical protein n=1 Tax=Erwinia persicina TaxID=55211 RepID=UPI000E54EC96|nr:hypothetical protein [Erwinia persicina]AXU94211.1 hypothetical protein CI789_02585 [Erwinia persicina]
MDMERAHDAVAIKIGEAVIQVIDEGGAVTNASVIEMLRVLSSGGEPDLAVEFALDLMRR